MIPEVLKILVRSIWRLRSASSTGAIRKNRQFSFCKACQRTLEGVSFKPYDAIDAGFRVALSGSSVQYDFSAESIAQMLSVRVNKLLSQYLKEAAGSLD